ncbi:transposase-like zinc-binding domain-containing protein [Francisella tularensis]
MIKCNRCHSEEIHKTGVVRNKQRYKCKSCGYNLMVE